MSEGDETEGRAPFGAGRGVVDSRKIRVTLVDETRGYGRDGVAVREMSGDEARAFSLELARVANNVDPPAPIEPRTHHYAGRLDDDGVRLHVYEEADGLPTAAGSRPTGSLTRLAASNLALSMHDLRRVAQSRFQFIELVVHRYDGRTETKVG